MNDILKLRDKIKNKIETHNTMALRIWNGMLSLIALYVVNRTIGYSTVLDKPFLIIVLAVFCAFMPLSGCAIVVIIFGLLHLAALSVEVSVAALVLIVISYVGCAFYGAKQSHNVIFVPVFYQIGMPYAIPVEAGLLDNTNEVTSVVFGSLFAYFLKAVRDNAGAFRDSTVELTVVDLFRKYILGSTMFYVYVFSMVILFLIVNIIRNKNIRKAWLVAIIAGILVELLIMLTGLLLTGNEQQIPMLIAGNFLSFIVGLLINFFVLDLDYSRTERVQFEDDDYYYYVTAVPKVKIAEEHKTVKTITNTPIDRSERKEDKGEQSGE